MIHAQRLKRCHYEDFAWSRNAEVSVREAERDEMEVLRREAAEVGAAPGAPQRVAEEAIREPPEEKKESASKKKKKTKKKHSLAQQD